jgi:hypothetical protein
MSCLIDAAGAADIQFEEKKVHKTIKDAAKRNDMATCKVRSSSSSSNKAASTAAVPAAYPCGMSSHGASPPPRLLTRWGSLCVQVLAKDVLQSR